MAKRNIAQLNAYIRATNSEVIKAYSRSLIEVTLEAERLAKRNAIQQFIGRNNRKLSGRLLNSIFTSFKINPGLSLPTSALGTRGLPYGRINELGGKIVPVKAKALWLKQHKGKAGRGRFKRMTPTEFFDEMKKQKGLRSEDIRERFVTKWNKGKMTAAGVETTRRKEFTPIFILKDEVEIPARPYLLPAVQDAVSRFPRFLGRSLAKALTSKFFK